MAQVGYSAVSGSKYRGQVCVRVRDDENLGHKHTDSSPVCGISKDEEPFTVYVLLIHLRTKWKKRHRVKVSLCQELFFRDPGQLAPGDFCLTWGRPPEEECILYTSEKAPHIDGRPR